MEDNFKMKTSFSKEEFFNLMDLLHSYAFNANLYLYFLEQLDNQKYHHMAKRFPCFYMTLRNSLLESMWLNLMRIYDRSTENGWNIGVLLDMSRDMCYKEHKHYGIFKEYQLKVEENKNKNLPSFNVKYTYFINDFDKIPPTLRDEINNAEKEREFINLLLQNSNNSLMNKPLEVKLTATELINHLSMLVCSQNKKINHVNEIRNKLFVHNVKDFLDDTTRKNFTKKHQLIIKDIKELAIIALRTIICIDHVIDKDDIPEEQRTYKPSSYRNQDDIVYVLDLLKKASDEEEKMIASWNI